MKQFPPNTSSVHVTNGKHWEIETEDIKETRQVHL